MMFGKTHSQNLVEVKGELVSYHGNLKVSVVGKFTFL